MKSLFFDLDGTLVDSSIGIEESFRHTFDQLNIEQPDTETIRSFMGPSLESSFQATLKPELVEQAVSIYRHYYHEKGQYLTKVYPGIKEALQVLKEKGFPLFVTTSKHEGVALQMCKDLGLLPYFHAIYGSTPLSKHKSDVLNRVIQDYQIDKTNAVIIGDTKFDLIGGQTVGIETIAVTWGFGDIKELLSYQPDYICHTPNDLYLQLKK